MVNKKKESAPETPPRLLVSSEDAEKRLRLQIEKGNIFLNKPISSEADVTELKTNYGKWNDFNEELIRAIFTGSRFLDGYQRHRYVSYSMNAGIQETVRLYEKLTKGAIKELESIIERLSLVPPEVSTTATVTTLERKKTSNSDIFLVHGHDNGLKEEVARFIEKIGLTTIILHEQANKGRTLIEKFEDHADVGFAVVLLTPDDAGGEAESAVKSPRARQNVVLELGYFMGALGRKKVCALYVNGVELPSDLSGILYVPLDENGAWKFRLAKEIKEAGIHVDLNRVT